MYATVVCLLCFPSKYGCHLVKRLFYFAMIYPLHLYPPTNITETKSADFGFILLL